MKKLLVALFIFVFNTINCASRLSRVARCLRTRPTSNFAQPITALQVVKQNFPVSSQSYKQNIHTSTKPLSSFSNQASRSLNNHCQKNLVYNPIRQIHLTELPDGVIQLPDEECFKKLLEESGFSKLVENTHLVDNLYLNSQLNKINVQDAALVIENEIYNYSKHFPNPYLFRKKSASQLENDLLNLIYESYNLD